MERHIEFDGNLPKFVLNRRKTSEILAKQIQIHCTKNYENIQI
jgi:hypothetical protein